jgi:short-subunit dehydrogenase
MKVKGKTIVVTGGGNGVGREIVLHLLAKGAKVVAVDMNPDTLHDTFVLSGKNTETLLTYAADITDRLALEKLLEKVVDLFDGVDGVINNAGIIQPFVKLETLRFETIERIVNVNFFGAVNVLKTFLPQLLSRPEAHIVNISSLGGFLPVAGQIVYGASKAALKLLSEGLCSELSDTNVRVTTVFPGAMQTKIKINSGIISADESTDAEKAKNTLQPTVAAKQIIAAMENNRNRFFIGKDSKSMNWIYKISPSLATHLIYNQIKYKFE